MRCKDTSRKMRSCFIRSLTLSSTATQVFFGQLISHSLLSTSAEKFCSHVQFTLVLLIQTAFLIRAWYSGTLLCTWKITAHLEVDLCRCTHLSTHYPLRALYSSCPVCAHQLTSLHQSWARLLLRAAEQLTYQAPCPQST